LTRASPRIAREPWPESDRLPGAERGVKTLSDMMGFRSDFNYEEHVQSRDWEVVALQSKNPMRPLRLVMIPNT
jgi:hypothetical protein